MEEGVICVLVAFADVALRRLLSVCGCGVCWVWGFGSLVVLGFFLFEGIAQNLVFVSQCVDHCVTLGGMCSSCAARVAARVASVSLTGPRALGACLELDDAARMWC